MLSRVCGAMTVSLFPKVNLSVSLTSKAAAAIALRHFGHPLATGSSFPKR